MTLAAALANLQSAVRRCHVVFHQFEGTAATRGLSHRFWVALDDFAAMAGLATVNNCRELFPAFKAAYHWLGAPGDFGYGTPCGDALAGMYHAWNDFCDTERQANVKEPT